MKCVKPLTGRNGVFRYTLWITWHGQIVLISAFDYDERQDFGILRYFVNSYVSESSEIKFRTLYVGLSGPR